MPLEAIAIGPACLTVVGLVIWSRILNRAEADAAQRVHRPNPPEDWYDRADELQPPPQLDRAS